MSNAELDRPVMDESFLYKYKATVMRVIDGDTVDVLIDLGCGIFTKERVRLTGIDAWEPRGEEREKGLIAKAWLTDEILSKQVLIETQLDKTGKYGRLTAEIYLDSECINDELVELGHAIKRDY